METHARQGFAPDTTALVIGAASGIGAALVELYQAAEVPVSAWDIAGDCDVVCDITDPAQIDDALAATLGWGPIPTEVTICAGISHTGTLWDTPADDFERIMAVNAKGPWLAMRAIAKAWADADVGGSMVATSGLNAQVVDRGMGLFSASKAALDMLVRVAAAEWGRLGIRVNGIAPGVTATPLHGSSNRSTGWLEPVVQRTPLGRLGDPAEMAAGAIALHGLEWVTGQVLTLDGGLSLRSPIDSFGWAETRGFR